jgi:hypothetical protein
LDSGRLSPFSVVGRGAPKRFSLLIEVHVGSRAPSLHQNYPASSLLWTHPNPCRPTRRLLIPPASQVTNPADRASQVPTPSLITRHPIDPEELNRCACRRLPCSCWLHHHREAGHSQLVCNEACTSSLALWLATSLAGASHTTLLTCTPGSLRVLSTLYTISSFHLIGRRQLRWRTGAQTTGMDAGATQGRKMFHPYMRRIDEPHRGFLDSSEHGLW